MGEETKVHLFYLIKKLRKTRKITKFDDVYEAKKYICGGTDIQG